ncbi:hypothetical protein J007_02122 [Cryptococcus neoformans]|nr:hypothetical protein C356_02144 [Cryptococcus neoformans var. grubii c45]OXB38068.1 hypothetical protein J007_02122 [Cryptococcus neoformans var. grubii]OXC62383.1 hypothetical protein C358_02188 [Cryptococcus neoformans var. grubii MW-RSA852]
MARNYSNFKWALILMATALLWEGTSCLENFWLPNNYLKQPLKWPSWFSTQ